MLVITFNADSIAIFNIATWLFILVIKTRLRALQISTYFYTFNRVYETLIFFLNNLIHIIKITYCSNQNITLYFRITIYVQKTHNIHLKQITILFFDYGY